MHRVAYSSFSHRRIHIQAGGLGLLGLILALVGGYGVVSFGASYGRPRLAFASHLAPTRATCCA